MLRPRRFAGAYRMTDGLCIHPAAILHGTNAAHAMRNGLAAPLAGGPAAFALAEVIRRCARTGEIARRWMSLEQLRQAAEKDAALAARLEALTAARPALAGMDLSAPCVMGIVNVTPDSFSDGGRHATAQEAIAHGRALAKSGADILDVGGESTRPGAVDVPVEEELARVIPVVRALAADGFTVSIDTRKAAVMEAAIAAGAAIINDVSALTFDEEAPSVAARAGLPVVLMHARGAPVDMQDDPEYEDVALDVFGALEALADRAVAAGVKRENIIIDPGIGFGKTVSHNLELMRQLALFHGLGFPVLLGASRKRFIGAVTGVEEAAARLAGSLAVAQAALAAGAQIVRVHDVMETVQMARMARAMQDGVEGL